MKFLVDNALSPAVAEDLNNNGHEALHLRQVNLQAADDQTVFAKAKQENRVLITADTDFAELSAQSHQAKPSIILFRRGSPRRPHEQAALLLANLPLISEELAKGCIAVFEQTLIRIRTLPIHTPE